MLLFIENVLITPSGIEPTNEVWIRLSGILLLAIAVYYMLGAKYETTVIWKATAFIPPEILHFGSLSSNRHLVYSILP